MISGILLLCAIGWASLAAFAQKARTKPASAKVPVFAVLGDGSSIEPIGYIDSKGKVTHAIDGSSDPKVLRSFHRAFYAKGKSYSLIFGGMAAGTVTVNSSDPAGECVNYLAKVTVKTTRTPLKGNIMALATNAGSARTGIGVRRLPTPAERSEVETLVRGEFSKNGVAASALTNLRSQNLTALDVDSDAIAELVGSYWVETSPKDRALLFFIAQRGSNGNYELGFSDVSKITESETMSNDIKDIDSGVYHERLLDVFDTDNDGVGEVFSYVMSFESAGFNVYKRKTTGWSKVFEQSNYHCGY